MVNLLLNFLLRRNISSETSGKLKFFALNNDTRRPSFKHFEKNALKRKCCEELNGNASDAYSRQGIHLALIKCNITSSEATRPILPKIPLNEL